MLGGLLPETQLPNFGGGNGSVADGTRWCLGRGEGGVKLLLAFDNGNRVSFRDGERRRDGVAATSAQLEVGDGGGVDILVPVGRAPPLNPRRL